jgi:hypothetical protein
MTALGRLRTGLRWLLLAQLAVGLLFQPVLGLASELHVHTPRTAAAHGPAVAAPAPERGIGAAFHRLHQLALCCSQAVQPPEILLAVANIGGHLPVMQANTRPYPYEHPVAPFRPPIAG